MPFCCTPDRGRPAESGQGIGKALLQHILSQMPCLTVISRGSATGFYERMGFEFADWNEIHLLFKNECAPVRI